MAKQDRRSGMRWTAGWVGSGVLMAVLAAHLFAAKPETAKVPAEFQEGETKFNTHCARCHGNQAAGTTQGPPLVHKIYEPNHHGDAAFQRAAANGVRAHHWNFGNMPKIDVVTPQDVDQIVKYIRWLQRQAGIM